MAGASCNHADRRNRGGGTGCRSSPVSSEAWTWGNSSLGGGVVDRRRFIGSDVRGGRHPGSPMTARVSSSHRRHRRRGRGDFLARRALPCSGVTCRIDDPTSSSPDSLRDPWLSASVALPSTTLLRVLVCFSPIQRLTPDRMQPP